MLKKFLHGLLFGTGFTVAYLLVMTVYAQLFSMKYSSKPMGIVEETINSPPSIPAESERYLGSTGSYFDNFDHKSKMVLATGSATLTGSASAYGQAVVGLRLRLALNGSVMSQWAVTDAQGVYRVAVPAGQYLVQGFELDNGIADQVVPGLILKPSPGYRGRETVHVAENGSAMGLDLTFVKPVIKDQKQTTFKLREPVILSWRSYEGASKYRVQVSRVTVLGNSRSSEQLFEWNELPEVTANHLDLMQYVGSLDTGTAYTFQVEAFDANGQKLSNTSYRPFGHDFKIVQ